MRQYQNFRPITKVVVSALPQNRIQHFFTILLAIVIVVKRVALKRKQKHEKNFVIKLTEIKNRARKCRFRMSTLFTNAEPLYHRWQSLPIHQR